MARYVRKAYITKVPSHAFGAVFCLLLKKYAWGKAKKSNF